MTNNIHKYALALLLLMLSIFVGSLIYIFLSNPKINPKLRASSVVTDPEILRILNVDEQIPESLRQWNWDYISNIDADEDYPLVLLRDGFKFIKSIDKGKALMGWKYEVLNVSDKGLYVTINYKVVDIDGFELGSSSQSEWVKAEKYTTIQNTLVVPFNDIGRIGGGSWEISSIQPSYKLSDLKEKGNRFERAGRVLKENRPYWIDGYIEFLNLGNNPLGDIFFPRWVTINKTLGIKRDERINEIIKLLKIDEYSIPPWDDIKRMANYKSLSDEDKSSLKHWLSLKKEYGSYDPIKGGFNYRFPPFKDDFED